MEDEKKLLYLNSSKGHVHVKEDDLRELGYVSQFAMKGLMLDRSEVVNCWWIQKIKELINKHYDEACLGDKLKELVKEGEKNG